MYKVLSEIHKETNFQTTKLDSNNDDANVLSKFKFCYPSELTEPTDCAAASVDKDGDLIVIRRRREDATKRHGIIEIEHSEATEIRLVGLQVWRGALLLADYIFHKRKEFADLQLLELGAGVGLTSIAASIYVQSVICTDVDIGGILKLIQNNVERNRKLLKESVQVLEYDFCQSPENYSPSLLRAIDNCEIVLAADVIYDDRLTDAFVRVMSFIFERGTITKRSKSFFVALEKRFVFTFAELDAVAPMFEHFLRITMHKPWKFEYISLDFPQYFEYERSSELVLIKITQA